MNENKQNLLMIKGLISEMPADDQKKIHEIANMLRELIKEFPCAGVAFALVGGEMASQD